MATTTTSSPKNTTQTTFEDGQVGEPQVQQIPGFSGASAVTRDDIQARRDDDETKSVTSSGSSIPQEVTTDSESGVEEGSLALAKTFMASQGQLARKCRRRGELSHLYLSTQGAWMSQEIQDDINLQRPFKQILFALAHGMKLVRVVDSGRTLLWNRYRDNEGNPIERDNRSDSRSRPQRGGRGHYNRHDDRGGRGHYNRRDDRGGRRGYRDRSYSPERRRDHGGRYQRRDDRDGRYQRRNDRDGRYQRRDDLRSDRRDQHRDSQDGEWSEPVNYRRQPKQRYQKRED